MSEAAKTWKYTALSVKDLSVNPSLIEIATRALSRNKEPVISRMDEELNKMGVLGWELVAVSGSIAYFKMPG